MGGMELADYSSSGESKFGSMDVVYLMTWAQLTN